MNNPTKPGDPISGLKLRLLPGTSLRARRRRVDRQCRLTAEFSVLEDRCLMSRGHLAHHGAKAADQSTIYVANKDGTPGDQSYKLQNVKSNPGDVIFLGGTSPNTPGVDWGTVPTKSFTFTNNSNNKDTIYPFLYAPNNTAIYDPIDKPSDEYRLYIGFEKDGKYVLGLPYGKSVTVNVPLVFWNGGRGDIATDGPHLIPKPKEVNDLNPYQFYYSASTSITTQGVISSNDNGVLMYYKANTPKAPNDPSPAAAGQLTEWTIRDLPFLTKVNQYDQLHNIGTIADSELTTLVNYDVSYVDDMTSPVAMKALQVPVPIAYVQNGTATTQGSTTTITLPTNPAPSPDFFQLLTKTYPYGTDPWQVKYNIPGSSKVISIGTITNISNGTITVADSGSVSGLPTNLASYNFFTNAVKQDYGWTGANNDIVQMQAAMLDFTSDNTKKEPNKNGLGQYFSGLGWPKYFNPDSKALLKIPSGASVLINSPLLVKTSPYDIHHYLLTSGNAGNQFFFNAQEDLVPPGQSTKAGDTITVKVSGLITRADLAAIKKKGGTWVLGGDPNTGVVPSVGTVNIKSIDPEAKTMTVTLTQDIPTQVAYSYLLIEPPNDPYTTKMTNLWYSWANKYVGEFSGQTVPGPISAILSADTDSASDTRILTPTTTPAAPIKVGMSVTGNGISGLKTVVKIVGNQLYLSAPVVLAAGQTYQFTVSNPPTIAYSNDRGLNANLLKNVNFGADASFASQFAATVYELLSNYSTVPENHSRLPNRSMDVVYEAIGGNVGFLPSNVNKFTQITSDVRDLGKSALRGVPNFITYSQQGADSQWQPGAWYPPPSKDMYGTGYNVYNLDPFVWFVHQKVGLSGYGFSFDDDVSDVGAGGASSLSIINAPGAKDYPQSDQWFPSTPWHTVTASARIAPVPDSVIKLHPEWAGKSMLTIVPEDVKAWWQVKADDLPSGLIGAYISTKAAGINVPANTNLLAGLDSNALEYVLSQNVTNTSTPISITFAAYNTPAATTVVHHSKPGR